MANFSQSFCPSSTSHLLLFLLFSERVQAGRDPGGHPLHRPPAGPAGRADLNVVIDDVADVVDVDDVPVVGGQAAGGQGEHRPGAAEGAAEEEEAQAQEEEEERVKESDAPLK